MVAPVAAGCVIGVDVGGTKILAGLVDPGLGVLHRVQRPSGGLTRDELLARLAELVAEAAGAAPGPVLGVGFGVPGMLDRRRGVVAAAPHLPLDGVRFEALMAERTGLPVAVDNDGNCTMLAEWRHGAARGCRDAVTLTVGTGVGGGIVVNGGLLRGSSGGGAEVGHMVLAFDGPPCQGECPGRGHYEWYASGNAIGRAGLELARDVPGSVLGRELAAGREITGALVTELAHDGDEHARAAIRLVGGRLGAGMVSLVNVFNPERIVVGGGAIAAGELLLGPAREEVARHAMPSLADGLEIVPAHFGAEAGMLGAATLAFEEFAG
jgi:glucokinase